MLHREETSRIKYVRHCADNQVVRIRNKMKQTTDNYTFLTHAPVHKVIVSMAVPTIISMLITSIYGMVDTYYVGKINTHLFLRHDNHSGHWILLRTWLRQLYLALSRFKGDGEGKVYGCHGTVV